MGTTLAQAYVQILPSMKGIKGNLQKELDPAGNSAGSSAGGKFSSAFKDKIAAAATGTTIVAGIAKSIKDGAALEQSIGGIETLFKDASGTVIKNADKAFKTAGISANSYMEQATSFSASLLQSLGGDTRKAAQYANTAIIDMSDNANKMGTAIWDIQNAYQGFAKQNYTMLDNLKLGYGGTKTEMERLLADASKISGQKYDISNLSDVYQAIHVIQGELGITGTSAKEAASTLSGSFNSMKSAAENFLGNLALGRNVTASMEGLATTTSTFLFKNLIPAIGNIFKSLPAAARAFIKTGIPELKQAGGEMLDGLVKGFANGDMIKKAISGAVSVSLMAGKGVDGFVDAGLKLAKNLAQGISNGLPILIKNMPRIIKNILSAISRNAPKIAKGGIVIIGKLAIGIIKSIPALIKSIPSIFKAFLTSWKAMNWHNLGSTALTSVKNGILKGIGSLASKVRGKFDAVKNAMTQPISSARSAISGIISKVRGMFPVSLGRIFSGIVLPHFKVSGGKAPWGIMGKGVAPSIDINWYKTGGIFDDPSVIGVGEAGSEAVVPLATLWQKIDNLISAVSGGGQRGGILTVVLQLDGKTIGETAVDYINGQTIIFGNNPINI